MTIFHDIVDQLRVANTEAIVRVVASEHPTNQQLLAETIFAIVKHWSDAYEAGNYDLRNEATVNMAHEMVSVSDKLSKGEIHLPYI